MDTGQQVELSLLNLYIDKNRDAPEGTALIIQYTFFIDWNKFVEVGFKADEEFSDEFHMSEKIQRVYEEFQRAGLIPEVAPSPAASADEGEFGEDPLSQLTGGSLPPEPQRSSQQEGPPPRSAMWATTDDNGE